MQDLVYYSPQHEGILLNEDGKLQSMTMMTNSTSTRMRRNNSSSSKQSLAASSTISSMASNVSSCARISPPSSFHNGLRRSTFDLSDYDSTTGTYCSSTTLRKRSSTTSSNGAATQALLDLANNNGMKSSRESFSSSTSSSSWKNSDNTLRINTNSATIDGPQPAAGKDDENHGRNSLESVIEDVFLGYMSILFLLVNMERQVRSLFRDIHHWVENVWETLRANAFQFEEPLERRPSEHCSSDRFPSDANISSSLPIMMQEQRDDVSSSQELLTPLKLVPPAATETSSGKDEWGHFTDFQEELADESSFIPSCSRFPPPPPRSSLQKLSSSGLTPLAEVQEKEGDDDEEEDEDEDWSF